MSLIMRCKLFFFTLLFICPYLYSFAEDIVLYNDNGQGGIHQSAAKVIVDEGQYFVDLPVPTYNGKTKIEHLKVYRVKDSARLLYHQEKWATKYEYVVERPKGWSLTIPCYFNMKSPWKPSLTEDPNDPNQVIPIKKLLAYHADFNEGKTAIKVVLIKTQGKYMLYYGDDYFAANIESNSIPLEYAPAWSKNYKYRSKISGFDVYFNIIQTQYNQLGN